MKIYSYFDYKIVKSKTFLGNHLVGEGKHKSHLRYRVLIKTKMYNVEC